MKKLIIPLILLLLLTPFAIAQDVQDVPLNTSEANDAAHRTWSYILGHLFNKPFAIGFYTDYKPGTCLHSDTDYVLHVTFPQNADGTYKDAVPNKIFLYSGQTPGGPSSDSIECPVEKGAVYGGGDVSVWRAYCTFPGGGPSKNFIYSPTPLTFAQVKACIPAYTEGEFKAYTSTSTPVTTGQLYSTQPVDAPVSPAKVCTGTSDLQITDVSYFPGDLIDGKYVPTTITLENQGGTDSFNENVECGFYTSTEAWFMNAFPLAFTKSTTNCVPTENNVRTIEVTNLRPNERTTVTLSPAFTKEKDVLVCGIYPKGKCGEYTNACQNNFKLDLRKK